MRIVFSLRLLSVRYRILVGVSLLQQMRQFGSFRLDLQNECVWQGEEQLSLTPRPFSVLRYLVENPQRLISHEELLDALWPETYVQPQVLRTYVLEIRRLLGDDPENPQYIRTVPKRGYWFVAEVTEVTENKENTAAVQEEILGRDAELVELDMHFSRALHGERNSIFVAGETGIGKTALVDAFCNRVNASSKARVARGQSVEGFGGKETFYPVREVLQNLCSEEDIRTLLSSLAPSWFARGSNPGPLLGEICEALELLSQQQPLVLIFEDVHWADSSTLDLISALARRRSRASLMLVATLRPADLDARHPLRGLRQELVTGGQSSELVLGPLPKDAVRGYLRRELKSETLPAGLTSFIHQHSEGNALFMVATLDHLRTQRLLVRDVADWSLRYPLAEIELGVPGRLTAMIELQLERLSDEDLRLLEAGSIAGTIFPAWAVAAVLERELPDVEEVFSDLVRRVRLVSIAGQDELPDGTYSSFYVFAHAMYREVLYSRLPASRRSRWHLRIADRLRSMFSGREELVAYEIAAHAKAGTGLRE
jgi:DNA-binding winged helix-turn-helix (wHTH) protein